MNTYSVHEYVCNPLSAASSVQYHGREFRKSRPSGGSKMVKNKRIAAALTPRSISSHLPVRRTALSLAIAASLPGAALAQNATDDSIEEVVVTGVRSSILNSIDAKRNNDVVSEVVDASDLGQLPDVSIADALGRLPGVTTVRDSGQGSQLNIRGMNGDFVQTTLNGREQASTSGYTAGSRWIAFDQYPSELINQAAVYKSPKASLIEGGVAGTVELKTANPLMQTEDHTITSNLRYSYNDGADNVNADDTGARISASYMGKFADDTLGVALGFAYLDQPNNAEEAITSGAANGYRTNGLDANGDGIEDPLSDQFLIRGASGTDERLGILGSVVWEPTDSLSFQVDYFRSDFESEDEKQGFVVEGLHRDASTYSFTNGVVQDGVVTGGSVTLTGNTGPWIEVRNEDQSTESLTESLGLRGEWLINDRSTLMFDVATSSGEKTRRDRIATMHAYEFGTATLGDGTVVDTWQELPDQSFTFQNNQGDAPSMTFNTDYTDLSVMRLGDWEQFPHEYTDDLDSIKLDFRYDMDGVISYVQVGGRYSDRTFGDDRATFRWGRREGQWRRVEGGAIVDDFCENNPSGVECMPMPLDGFVEVESFGGSLGGFPDYLVVDLDAIANNVFGAGNYDANKDWNHNWTLIESGEVREKVDAYYVEAGLDFEMFGIPVLGNFGVRHVRTDTKSIGIQLVGDIDGDGIPDGIPITDDLGVTNSDYQPVNYGPEYSDTLPSLNLNFQLTDNDQIRFAAAKVMGRPPVFQLRGGAGSWVDTADDGVSPRYNVWSKGNPNLDPFRANQIDLSYEHYFDDGGAFIAAVFWKDVETLIENLTYFEDDFGGDFTWADIGLEAPPGFVEGQYQTAQNNDNGGYIRGVELAYTTTFDNLPGLLSGLGINANYAYTESETTINGGGNFPDQQLPLPGLSENVWSATVFWDVDRFSTFLNARYRDEYVFQGTSPGGASLQWADEYLVMDWQASYFFDNGISLVAQVNNLTDEVNSTFFTSPWAVGEAKRFGRQFYFGINYKSN
jgi:iron complex outermembrane receptor protein